MEVKKIFIALLLSLACPGLIIANDQFWIKYNDDSVVHYYANYGRTWFYIDSGSRWAVWDESLLDDSRAKSRKDYDRIYNEITAAHAEAISGYEKYNDGQAIIFKHGYIKDMGK